MVRFLVFAALSACSYSIVDKPGDRGPDEEEVLPPSIILDTPENGAARYSDTLDLAWTVENLVLDANELGGSPTDGHGHVHVYLDGTIYEESTESGLSLEGIEPGVHTVLVRLAGNDHAELPASDAAEVQMAFPTLELTAPADGAVLDASNVPLTFTVDGFALSPDRGAPDVFGEGHYTISVDGQFHDWGTDPASAEVTGIPEGTHTVRVELVTNDGQPLDPPVAAEVSLFVPSDALGVYWDRDAFSAPYDSATLPLALSVTSMLLVPSDGTVLPVAGQGHMHLFMDGAWLTATADTELVLQHVAPGDHLFEVRLATNDSIELAVIDRLWVNIPDDRPDAVVTYPGPDWIMSPSFNLTFEAENFSLDASGMDGANVHHEGHAQVVLDGVLQSETAEGIVPLWGLALGTHQLRVELANNDRTPVTPAVYTEFDFVVQ